MNNREKLIKELKDFYSQNLEFISKVEREEKEENSTATMKYSSETIFEFKMLNSQLFDYIKDIEYGLECDKTLSDWCNLFADVLSEDDELDDDNFLIGGNW